MPQFKKRKIIKNLKWFDIYLSTLAGSLESLTVDGLALNWSASSFDSDPGEWELTTGLNFEPAFIPTTMAAGNGCGSGNMFDIEVKSDPVVITGFETNPRTNGILRIWYKEGTYVGFTNSSSWTLVQQFNVTTSNGTVELSEGNYIELLPNSTYGIYVEYDANYTTVPVGTSYSDDYMTLAMGHGLCQPFDQCCSPRAFNGGIYYLRPS